MQNNLVSQTLKGTQISCWGYSIHFDLNLRLFPKGSDVRDLVADWWAFGEGLDPLGTDLIMD